MFKKKNYHFQNLSFNKLYLQQINSQIQFQVWYSLKYSNFTYLYWFSFEPIPREFCIFLS